MSTYSMSLYGITPYLELIFPHLDTNIGDKIVQKWTDNTGANKLKIFGLVVLAGLASIPGALVFSDWHSL